MSISQTTQPSLSLAQRYRDVRAISERIVQPLSPEDCMVQSMPDTSPTRWHLAHTTWFFETFILASKPGFQVFNEHFKVLFNSYYNTVGDQFPRPQRGFISRPGLAEIVEYRRFVDERMDDFLNSGELSEELLNAIEIGLHHEQQHQELMLTDIKHVLSCNPTLPVYQPEVFAASVNPTGKWFGFEAGVYEVGHSGQGFAFDNELPRHRVFLH